MQMTQKIRRRATLGAVAAASLAAGMVLASRLQLTPASRAAAEREAGVAPPVAAAAAQAMAPAPGLPGFNFVKLAEEEKKFVVNINTTKSFKHRLPQRQRGPLGRQPFGNEDDFFEHFFGQVPEQDLKQQSLGSGFIVDKEGYILTNNHVVEGADDIRVTLLDGRSYDAEIKGRDPKTDIALIRIKPENGLPVATLGDSDALQVGEWVIAIGNPFGFGHTVTAGVVSAKDRTIGAGPYDAFIQTDASINPGNSGGPLFNARGEVVGINSAIIASGQGIGFAIPINMAKTIMEQLREKGSVTRGWLGVQVQPLTPELRESLQLAAEGGALVAGVIKGDPADKAGLKAGDVVVEFDGRAVRSDRDLVAIVGNTAVGRSVSVKVLRDGKSRSFEIRIARRSDEKDEAAGGEEESGDEKESGKARLGVRVQDVTKELAEKLGLDETARGARERGDRRRPGRTRRHRPRRRGPRGQPAAGRGRRAVREAGARRRAGEDAPAARAQRRRDPVRHGQARGGEVISRGGGGGAINPPCPPFSKGGCAARSARRSPLGKGGLGGFVGRPSSCWPGPRRGAPRRRAHRRGAAARRGGARRRAGAPDGRQRQHRGGGLGLPLRRRRRPLLRPVLPRLLRVRAAAQGHHAQPRLGGDRRPAGLHPHQRARHRPRLARERHARRRAHLPGEDRRHRPRPRPGGHQGRGEGAAPRGRDRRLGRACSSASG